MPRKKEERHEENAPVHAGVISRSITAEMQESYLDYAMSVITSRAIPDVRDGLKPVHRRILFTMHELNLAPGGKTRKSAKITGDVTGNYHPHGDTAVYDALAKLAQDFTMRYPLVIGQGNFGCFTKDTKIRLADGRSISFDNLVKEDRAGKTNYAYTIHNDGRVALAKIERPRRTIRNAELVEVEIDSGEKIRCTPNHRFLLKDQTYKEAQHLTPGVSLMPLYTRLSKKGDAALADMEGYEMVFQPLHDEWTLTHHLADAYNLSNRVYTASAGRVRHHSDFNKLNNNPDNIARMHWSAHWKLHAGIAASRHANNPEYVQNIAAGRRAFWAKKENREAYRTRMRERNITNWQDATYREEKSAALSETTTSHFAKHPELREVVSQRATRTLKRLWQDSAYRRSMREKIVKGNKNHTTNRTGKVKFDAICAHVFSTGATLSERTYEKVRKVLYPYGSATRFDTGLSKYYDGDTGRVRAELVRNHKVVRVHALAEREDVYDLTISGTHNFALASGVFVHNSIDGDAPAAPRYTEAKMSRVAVEMLRDIEKETVEWRPNYEGTRKEPVVLPSVVPNLLLNGTLGIAVGMATNIPPHNLKEIIDATVHLIDHPKSSIDDLMAFVKGPDFPVGGIAYNTKDMAHAYTTGRGPVVVRGEAEITEDKKGNPQIIITSIPYRVNKADLIVKIADLVREKKLDGIKDLRDESTKDIRVVVDLKASAQPQAVLNYLYKHTQLEEAFHFNMVTLVDGVPQTLSLDGILSNFIGHRKDVVRRRTEFDLGKAKDREHILLGLTKALDHIDEIIALIKKSNDVPSAHAALRAKFKFSDAQASAILEMRLSKLAGLERKKIEDELKEVQALITELESILASEKKMLGVIKDELKTVGEKYGDPRRTKIVKGGVKNMSVEDLVPDEPAMLTLTNAGYIKRTSPSEYKKQHRGGVGVIDLSTKDEDFVTRFVEGSTHDAVLFFTDRGKVYRARMYEIPEGKRATKGKSIMNVLPLSQEEQVTGIVIVPKKGGLPAANRRAAQAGAESFLLVTQGGTVKKVKADAFEDVRKSGIIAITLSGGDRLIAALPVSAKETVSLVTAKGQSIRFKEADVRTMGRTAAGVSGMKITKGDTIVGADVVRSEKDTYLLVVTNKGYGKRTDTAEYKVQKRAGSGIKTANVTAKTGPVIAALIVDVTMAEIIVASKKGQVIRTELSQVPKLGRATQGVRVMKLREGDAIAAFTAF